MTSPDETISGEYVDPRITRTKERLFLALLDLIQEKRWEKIRVQEILDNTGISRSTFYAHYENKYDLLTSGTPDMAASFAKGPGELELFPLFAHVNEAAPVLAPLMSQPVLSEIVDLFHSQFVEGWREFLKGTPRADDQLLVEMLAGSLVALVRSYAVDKARPTPEEFTDAASVHFWRLVS